MPLVVFEAERNACDSPSSGVWDSVHMWIMHRLALCQPAPGGAPTTNAVSDKFISLAT